MAVQVGNNQNFRLRDLRDEQLGRAKSQQADRRGPARPTRRFEESLKNPKAGEVVGEFPAKYDKAPARQRLRRDPLQVAKERSRPRSPVAALMARDGVSTYTRLGAKFASKSSEEKKKEEKDEQPAWMRLLDDAAAGADADVKARFDKKKQELKAVDGFLDSVAGYSELEQAIKRNDDRTLQAAGKLDRALATSGSAVSTGAASKQEQNMKIMKAEMQMDQQLNMRYLALQDKLQQGFMGLVSNMMKIRNELCKEAISGGG